MMDALKLAGYLEDAAVSDNETAEELRSLSVQAARGDIDLKTVEKRLGILADILALNVAVVNGVAVKLREPMP